MGNRVRSELSEKNQYWIEKHRYYELKHFCLQYPIWKKAYAALDGLAKRGDSLVIFSQCRGVSDPTAKCAEARVFYAERIELLEKVAKETDIVLWHYILLAVTTGVSYDNLKARLDIPCCKDSYYQLYRRFFWLLNKERG